MKSIFPIHSAIRQHGLAVAVISAITLVGVGLSLALYDTQVYRTQALKQATVQAKILAASVSASLMFGDPETAQEYANALEANPEIAAAAVYNDEGTRIASFARAQEEPLVATLTMAPNAFEGEYLNVTESVIQNGRAVGTVSIRSLTEPINRRLLRYAGIILLVTMGVLVATIILIGRATLARANAQLLATNAQLQQEMQERERVEDALRQSQKMEAIGQLTGGIAHDFNNMLAIVIGGLDLMRRRAAKGETDLVKYIDAPMEGATRAASLTQRLLAFSRQQPLRPEPADVNRLVAGMSDLLRRTLGENLGIETVLAAGLWRIKIDSSQLENVILNLAVNGRDAMPDGGKLTLETANAHIDDAYAKSAEVTPGQYVMIAVTDTGFGMSPDVLSKAFDPFFTTKEVGRGTGLGLSQVYGFVRQSGGHVKIYSEVGFGTTVKIYLPRYRGELEPVIETSVDLSPSGGGNKTILVVEDEEAVRRFAVAALRELGYLTYEAANARIALDILRSHPEISILFTDVVMPDINGRQLADEALVLRPDLRVLFTTGYARNAAVHGGVLGSDVQVLSKPFSIEQLNLALRSLSSNL